MVVRPLNPAYKMQRFRLLFQFELQHLQAGLAPLEGVAALVGEPCDHLPNRGQPFRLQHAFLRLPPFADVAHNPRKPPRPTAVDLTYGDVDGKTGTVLASPLGLATDPDDLSLARPVVSSQVVIVLLAVRRRHEHRHIVSQHLAPPHNRRSAQPPR